MSNITQVKVWDGTNIEAVKAASTSAVAADPAAVVQISPNQPNLTIPLNTSATGTLSNNSTPPAATEVGVLSALANATSPLWTEGNQVLGSVDLHGGQRTMSSNIPETTVAWTSATAGNTTSALTVLGYSSVIVTLNQTTTITGGVVTFEVSDTTAFTNPYVVSAVPLHTGVFPTLAPTSLYTLVANTNAAFLIPVAGWAAVRVRLSTVITGTGTVNVGIAASNSAPWQSSVFVNSGNVFGVRSAASVAALADNQLSTTFFSSGNAVNDPMSVGDWVYGGAFSGTADAARQGWSKMRSPTIFRTASVAATATGNTAVWTPGTGNKFRLMRFVITAQGLAATATGVVTVSFQDAAAGITFGTFDVDVPAVAGTATGVTSISSGWIDMGNGFLSSTANNALNFNISAAGAGTVGTYRVNVAGTEE